MVSSRMGNYIQDLKNTTLSSVFPSSASSKQSGSRPVSPGAGGGAKSPEKPPKRPRYFVVCETCVGRRLIPADSALSRTRHQLNRPPIDIDIEPGNLMRQIRKDSAGDDQRRVLCEQYQGIVGSMKDPTFSESVELDQVYLVSPASKLSEVSEHQANILLAIDDWADRFQFFADSHRFEKLAKTKLGEEVDCLVEDHSLPPDDAARIFWNRGRIEFIGPLKQNFPALYFGIHLKESALGDNDGTFGSVRLFDCATPNGGLFVSANRLRALSASAGRNTLKKVLNIHTSKDTEGAKWYTNVTSPLEGGVTGAIGTLSSSPASSQATSSLTRRTPSPGGVGLHVTVPNPVATVDVKVGDRIVWLNNSNEACYGTVKWVGLLDQLSLSKNDLYAGVEFDDPIGGGTGHYRKQEYFCAKTNHASFVPLIGLLKKEDFEHGIQSGSSMPVRKPSLSVIPSDDTASDFTVGSCVEVPFEGSHRYGVVRFVGDVIISSPHEETQSQPHTPRRIRMAGLEMEDDLPYNYTASSTAAQSGNGCYLGRRYFTCSMPRRAFFAPLIDLKPDHRFTTPVVSTFDFGPWDSGDCTEYVSPPSRRLITDFCGANKGIQGHRNSCYLDATLYAMFAHTRIFDSLLLRPAAKTDIKQYSNLVKILANEIVYPLRKKHYVRADRVVKFRELLSNLLPEIHGLTSDEKDPEEFLNSFLKRLLKAPPYAQLIYNGKEEDQSYLCQLITEDEASLKRFALPTVKNLLERSFFESQLQFRQVPRMLILQLPRYGTQRVYNRIVPPIELDVTFLVDASPKPCRDCSRLARYQCEECFLTTAQSLEDVTFCLDCFDRVHYGAKTDTAAATEDMAHKPKRLRLSKVAEAAIEKSQLPIPAHSLQLLAVLCIETSHYVSFTRVGEFDYGRDWVFFDSMADREGYSQGYNIPHVELVEDMGRWLTADGYTEMVEATSNGRYEQLVPDPVKRLMKDCYICFYASREAHMYS